MKIRKIYIKNFKGIKDKKIIDFEKPITLLTGPNGFGKTTIFDVIELCLTETIHRTSVKKDVTKDTKDYKKPFYQNTKDEDVIIKLWLESNEEHLIIVKYLPKTHYLGSSGGRKNKPNDFSNLETYKDTIESFEDDEFDTKKQKLTSADINKFFGFKINKARIEELYRLFNYLQQEETTFFLKKSETDRKDELGFLFQTNGQETNYDKISEICKSITKIKNGLEGKITQSEISAKRITKIKYRKIFQVDDIDLDSEEPFQKLSIDEAIQKKEFYFESLNSLSDFIVKFSTEDYFKKISSDKITNIMRNKVFINFFILSDFLEDIKYEELKKEFECLEDDNLKIAYILKRLILKIEEYEKLNKKHDEYTAFLELKDFNSQVYNLRNLGDELFPERKEEYAELIAQKRELESMSDELSKTITEILRLRNQTKKQFEKIENSNEKSKCPFCGFNWDEYNKLLAAFDERTRSLRELVKNKATKLEDFDNIIRVQFIEPIIIKVKEYLEKNKKIDETILTYLKISRDKKYDFEGLEKLMGEKFTWKEVKESDELQKDMKKMNDELEKNILVSNNIWDRLKELRKQTFTDTLDTFKLLIDEKEISHIKLSTRSDSKITEVDLDKKSKELVSILENEMHKKYKYESDRAIDKDGIFKKYFDNNSNFYNQFKESDIQEKKEYLNNKLYEKKITVIEIYQTRLGKINNIIRRIESLKTIYNNTIKDYKKKMVEKIKIPFFIYTAKILQNYQQGMGIFLWTKENSDAIRFLTDNSSDHDAMHHLSSGQLAVVSLAFCLAINKTYNVSESLKFLAIDDPIQEMDVLNIHSFIELMRHEFINDYQLIFSTHIDSHALYLKYKFEKMKDDSVQMINVQDQFYS